MSLSFPSYFPEAFLRSVVAVQAKAEREFRKALRQVPVHHFGGKGSVPDHQAYRELSAEYVRKLVLSFAHQACEAARAGKIPLDQVAWYIDEFIRHATVHAFYDFNLRRAWGRWESFRDDMAPAIHESDGYVGLAVDEKTLTIISEDSERVSFQPEFVTRLGVSMGQKRHLRGAAVAQLREDAGPRPGLMLVQNWHEELKRLVPNN